MIRSLLILAALVGLSPLRAEPVHLTKTEAFELHDALTKLSPGLTPENTFYAADVINALTSDATAWRTGYTKLMILQSAANTPGATPETLAAFRDADLRFSTAADVVKTYDLSVFSITKEEVKASVDPKTGLPAMNANSLATIKRLLKPVPKEQPKDTPKS